MTTRDRIARKLSRSRDDVFVRREFAQLGNPDQVGRILRDLLAEGMLVRAGYGIYVRARPSGRTGNPVPVVGLKAIAIAALRKLGVETSMGRADRNYAEGRTTQMSMREVVNVGRARVTRRIGYGARVIAYERDSDSLPLGWEVEE